MRALVANRRQRGAVSLMAVLLIATVAIGALVSIDVGFVFYSQRQLQKMVDLAALSGAQQLKRADDLPATTGNVMASVSAAAAQNGYPGAVGANCTDMSGGNADGMSACLGLWDPANASNGDAVRHFNAAYDTTTVSPNAVRVQATLTVPLLFLLPGGQSRQLHAEAIAAGSPPVASFTIGSGILSVSSANGILSLLLGNSVNLSVGDWNGLVGANVTLEQLRLRANVGTVDQLLNTTLSIRDFYALVLGAAGQQALLNAALGSPVTQLGLNGIGTNLTLAQLLDLGVLTPAASSAAEVALNVASLLTTAAYVARGTSAVALNIPNLNVPVPGLGGASATASLTIIDPPKVAVGPARQLPDGSWKTTATTAQLGLNLTVKSNLSLLGLVTVDGNLPVLVRAGQAKGDLKSLQCATTSSQRRATVNVSTQLLNACLTGDGRECMQAGKTPTLANVTVLPILGPVVSTSLLGNPVSTNPAFNSGTDIVLAPGGQAATASNVAINQTVNNLLSNLNPSLAVNLFGQLGINLQAGDLLTPLLTPVATLLNTVVNWLFATLGIDIATATVWLNGIDCNNAELVY